MLILSVGKLFSQQQNLPLNREFNLVNQKVFNAFGNNVHTSFQPINQSFVRLDSIFGISKSEKNIYLANISKTEKKPRNFFKWMYRSAFYENFMVVDTGNFYLTIDPLLNIEVGKDDYSGNFNPKLDNANTTITDYTLSKNTRGVIVRGNVGEKFSFETSFYENQMTLPSYLSDYADAKGVVQGQGRWKKFKTNGYDFASSSANISYSPAKFINFQLGSGKNFVGDGYRSLLLSDFSFNYPYLKITTTFGKKNKFQYTKLNASLSSITRREEGSTAEQLFVRKSMSVHYLSWLAAKWLNIGLFESTLWKTEDSTGTLPYQFQQLNPIIGVNTITTITDDANHSNIGLNMKIKLPFKLVLYNQLVYDGNQYEKTSGYQVGMKYFEIKNLTLQAEYNRMINQYNTTFEPQLEQFTNYNESLTHPFGDNFTEIVGIINYKYKRLFFEFKGILAERMNLTTPIKTTVFQSHIGYLINPKNNMSLTLGIKERFDKQNGNIYNGVDYFYVGFSTNLRNLYDDF
ncbi:MAG: hypothetical protein COX70_02750 [Flavobacteriales bacterium CG_4_10_14_0_2_um_filter_32_8]|nr:MAG: hypothetical protein COX70_02750 [Flavobacteriales bacterium CG_4_10_14_0_2_um_filter_32_8]